MSNEFGVSQAAEPMARPRFTLRSLFIATTTICILLALIILPAIQAARSASQRMTCANNLQQIALALLSYRDLFKTFPSAVTYADDGTPMRSWRVAIVPHLVQNSFLNAYDFREPWNGPKNRLLGDEIPDPWRDNAGKVSQYVFFPPWFRCPTTPLTQDPLCTNYVMLIDDRPGKPNGPPNRPGSAAPSSDEKSAVIVIEIADSDIHWMEPRDVLLSELSMKINDRSRRSVSSHHDGAFIAHADGTVELLNDATTEVRVRELLAK
jgi:hypothetical protein